jgi:hypothetical protein
MAWEAVTKDQVAPLAGIRSTDLKDEWYDFAVGTIEYHTGLYNLGSPVAVTEIRNGNGMSRISVKYPPIASLSSVTVDGSTLGSGYIAYDTTTIYTKEGTGLNPYLNSIRFNRGVQNIGLSYISGTAVIDQNYSLTLALVIKELANLTTAEGAEARVQFFKPGRSSATEDPLFEWGLHGKIKGIIEALMGVRFRIR